MVNGRRPPLRAQKFPAAISLSAAFSSSASANNRFKVAFSRSSSFNVWRHRLSAPELVSPSVVRLLGALQVPADVGDLLALGQQPVCLGELAHNLLGRVPFPVAIFPVAIVIVLPAHNVGEKTLTAPGPANRGQRISFHTRDPHGDPHQLAVVAETCLLD